jgi:CheY-like chemotaxis protein
MKEHFILWAEDDPDDMALFRSIVEQVGERSLVLGANDGREVLACLQLMRKEKLFPCLVILDMNMPALGGRETIGLMKQEEDFAAIPIAVFTTSSQQVDRIFCDRFGVPLFTKPSSIDELKTTVRQILRLCRCQQPAADSLLR